jgi:hypothetical protein
MVKKLFYYETKIKNKISKDKKNLNTIIMNSILNYRTP